MKRMVIIISIGIVLIIATYMLTWSYSQDLEPTAKIIAVIGKELFQRIPPQINERFLALLKEKGTYEEAFVKFGDKLRDPRFFVMSEWRNRWSGSGSSAPGHLGGDYSKFTWNFVYSVPAEHDWFRRPPPVNMSPQVNFEVELIQHWSSIFHGNPWLLKVTDYGAPQNQPYLNDLLAYFDKQGLRYSFTISK